MAATIAVDLTRLLVAVLRGRPRGIERVDFDLAEDVVRDWPGDVFGVIGYPFGPRLLDRTVVATVTAGVRSVWAEDGAPEADPVLRAVRAKLGDVAVDIPAPRRERLHLARIARFLRHTGLRAGRPVRDLARGATYLNVGQVGFALPQATGWLAERPDLKVVSFLHDLLPLAMPESFGPDSAGYFRRVLDGMLRHSRRIVVSTAVTAQALAQLLEERGRRDIEVTVAPIVPKAALAHRRTPDGALDAFGYVMVCGTIESRKNHLLPLLLWRDRIARGEPVPKLVLAGARGWGAAAARDLIDRSRLLRPHVVEASGLSTPALMHLMAHANLLLAPSFAEGYGLPVAEALTLGTPVAASDIAVFREVTQGAARLIDPLDGPGWAAHVAAHMDRRGPAWRASAERASRYRPPQRDLEAFG